MLTESRSVLSKMKMKPDNSDCPQRGLGAYKPVPDYKREKKIAFWGTEKSGRRLSVSTLANLSEFVSHRLIYRGILHRGNL